MLKINYTIKPFHNNYYQHMIKKLNNNNNNIIIIIMTFRRHAFICISYISILRGLMTAKVVSLSLAGIGPTLSLMNPPHNLNCPL